MEVYGAGRIELVPAYLLLAEANLGTTRIRNIYISYNYAAWAWSLGVTTLTFFSLLNWCLLFLFLPSDYYLYYILHSLPISHRFVTIQIG